MSRISPLQSALLSVATLALLAACASTRGAGGAELTGLVLLGPQCAASVDSEGCPDLPTSADIVVRQAATESHAKSAGAGESIARGSAGEDGRFLILVPPGDYLLEATALAAMSCTPLQVTIPSEGIHVTITCETGIR